MKKFFLLMVLPAFLILQFCSPSKKTTQTSNTSEPAQPTGPMMTFEAGVMPLISTKCTPCHTSGDKAFTIYTNAKEEIDDIISRVQRNPGEKGFMPHKRDKLSEAEINTFIQWKQSGLSEK